MRSQKYGNRSQGSHRFCPVKANAYMERLLDKQPERPGPKLLPQADEQNGLIDSVPKPVNHQATPFITTSDSQLRRLAKHQQNLKQSPTALASNPKAQLLSNKTVEITTYITCDYCILTEPLFRRQSFLSLLMSIPKFLSEYSLSPFTVF